MPLRSFLSLSLSGPLLIIGSARDRKSGLKFDLPVRPEVEGKEEGGRAATLLSYTLPLIRILTGAECMFPLPLH